MRSARPAFRCQLFAVCQQLGIDVHPGDVPVRPDRFREQQGVQPDAAADIQPAAAGWQLQFRDQPAKEGFAQRLPIQ